MFTLEEKLRPKLFQVCLQCFLFSSGIANGAPDHFIELREKLL